MKILHRREDWPLLLLAVMALTLAYVFSRFGSEVVEGELLQMDQVIREWVVDHRSRTGILFFKAMTMVGAKLVLVPLSIVVGWFVVRRSVWWPAWLALIVFAAFASTEFVGLLKGRFAVVRPPEGLLERASFSFPSGHTTGTTAVAVLLSYIAFRRRVAWRAIVAGSVILVLLVGVSRVYLDMHWMSDVAGGWLVGAMLGITCCALYEWIERKRAESTAR